MNITNFDYWKFEDSILLFKKLGNQRFYMNVNFLLRWVAILIMILKGIYIGLLFYLKVKKLNLLLDFECFNMIINLLRYQLFSLSYSR